MPKNMNLQLLRDSRMSKYAAGVSLLAATVALSGCASSAKSNAIVKGQSTSASKVVSENAAQLAGMVSADYAKHLKKWSITPDLYSILSGDATPENQLVRSIGTSTSKDSAIITVSYPGSDTSKLPSLKDIDEVSILEITIDSTNPKCKVQPEKMPAQCVTAYIGKFSHFALSTDPTKLNQPESELWTATFGFSGPRVMKTETSETYNASTADTAVLSGVAHSSGSPGASVLNQHSYRAYAEQADTVLTQLLDGTVSIPTPPPTN